MAAQAAIYYASVVLPAVHFCDFEFPTMKLSLGLNKYSFRDFRFQSHLHSPSRKHIVYIANRNELSL